jgi:hypothetical protein
VWAATALTACGRLGYEPVPAGDTDAMPGADVVRPDARPAPDAQPPQPDAPPGPFRAAALIEELAAPDADDDDPSLTGDLLEIYFKSDRGTPGDFDIWRAVRESADQPWGAPERVDELSTTSYEATPEVSSDGLVMYLASTRDGGVDETDIWLSTRASRADPWGEPDVVVELSSDEDEWAAVSDESGTHVVITRSVPGNVLDLLGASRASADEPWGAPAPLANLATPVYEADGHLDPSGLRLFFAGELAGGDGRDIYIAERPSPEDDFGPPARVAELSSGSRDEDPWVSPDGNVIVISSDRTGDQELYWSSR